MNKFNYIDVNTLNSINLNNECLFSDGENNYQPDLDFLLNAYIYDRTQ